MFGMSRMWMAVTRAIEDEFIEENLVNHTYDSYIKNQYPLAYWRLGDVGPTTAIDEIGTYDGTAVGTTKPTFGADSLIVGDDDTAITFTNTTGERINCGTSIGNQGIRSIVLSFKPTNDFSSSETAYQALIYRWDSVDNADNFGIRLDPTTGKLEFIRNVGTTPTSIVSDSAYWIAGTTYHVVAVIDGTNGMELYIDGQKQTDTDVSTGAVQSETEETAIGSWGSYTGGNRTFDGVIDEVSLFENALSQAEITDLYNLSINTSVEKSRFFNYIQNLTPLAYYRLGESVGTIAYDISGNNYHGTYTGSPTLGTTGLITGDTDTAVDFNGSTQYMDFDTSFPDTATTISVVATYSTNLADNTGTNRYILDRLNTSEGYGLYIDTSDNIVFSINGGGGTVSYAAPTDSGTHTIVGIYDLTNIYLYIDGILVDTTAYTTAISYTTSPRSQIGRGIAGNYFNGIIDEVVIFGSVLTHLEVQNIFNLAEGRSLYPTTFQDTVLNTTPLIYYRLGETGTATSVVDKIAAVNGTYVATPNLDVDGFVVNDTDTAMYTNGTDEWANIAAALPKLELYSTGSISFIASFPSGGQAIIAFGDASDDTTFIFFYIKEDRVEYLYKYDGAPLDPGTDNFARTNDGPFLADRPYHVTFVQDDTEGALIYINGVKLTTYTRQGAPGARWWKEAATLVDTCAINSLQRVTDAWYESTIDEVVFYNYRLSATQISDMYNALKASNYTLTIDNSYITEDLYDFPVLLNLTTDSGVSLTNTQSIFESMREHNSTVDILGDSSTIVFCDFDGDVVDNAGNYSGTTSGTPAYADSTYPYFNQSITNNSSDDYVMFNGLGTWFDSRTAFTINIVLTPYSSKVGSGFAFCVSNTTHIPSEYRVAIILSTTGLHFYINTTGVSLSHSGTFSTSTLYNVTITYDGSIILMYLDGEYVASLTYSSAIGGCHANASLGRIPASNTPSNYALHTYDSMRIFDRAITPREVLQISNTNNPLKLDILYPSSNFDKPKSVNDYFTGTNNDAPNTMLWVPKFDSALDSGTVAIVPDIQGNELDFSVTTDIANGYVESTYLLEGDFDIQVDFSMDAAPTTFEQYLIVTDTLTDTILADNYSYIGRSSSGPYRALYTGGTAATGGTADTSGILRMKKVGTNLDNMYWNGTGWTTLNSDTTFTSNSVKVRLFARTHTTNQTFNCNFDNYLMNIGTPTWTTYSDIPAVYTRCNAEIERWDSLNQTAQLWVKVPYISANNDTVLTLSADVSNNTNTKIGHTGSSAAANVWLESYDAVYHLSSDGLDSRNINNGTLKNMDVTNIKDYNVGKSLSFNGTDEWIDLGLGNTFDFLATEDVTIEQNISFNSFTSAWRTLQNRGTGSSGTQEGFQISGTTGAVGNTIFDNTGGAYNNLSSTTVHILDIPSIDTLIFKQNDGELNLYQNGILELDDSDCTITGDMTDVAIASTRNATIGCAWDSAVTQSQHLNADLREIRFSKTLKPASWIYTNLRSNKDNLIALNTDSTYETLLASYSPSLYWKLNDEGTSIVESVAGTYNGTRYSKIIDKEKPLIKNSISNSIYINSNNGIQFGTPGTDAYSNKCITFLAKFNDLTSNQVIFKEGGASNGWGVGIQASNFRVAFTNSTTTYSGNVATSGYSLDTIYHFVAILDTTNSKIQLYINDSLDIDSNTTILTHNGTGNATLGSSSVSGISTYSNPLNGTSVNEHLDGWVDQVAVFNSVLTTTQITNLYNASK